PAPAGLSVLPREQPIVAMNPKSPAPVIRAWILEDHEIFAKQMRRLIAGEPDLECSHHFSTADELFDKLRFTTEQPDVLLLDLGLPRRDGLEVLCDLRASLPELKVLILSAH